MKSRIYGAVMVILSMSMAAGAKVIYVDSVKAPTVQGMVGFWDMNDNAATQIVTDSSVNANHGTAVRNTSEMTIPGKYGRALNFNGTSDFVDLGTNSLLLPDAWTLVAWVKCQVMDSPTLFSFGRTDLTVRLQNGGKGKPVIMMGSNNYKYFTGSAWTTLQDGQWHFVVFSVPGIAQTDIQNAKMYLDGVPVTGT
ncbi:MAG: LamG domain-containing protein, partial [Phycisphaerae bacterium]|nr:LamG domain-containing protein [Phycisphaerae bacterium]